MTTTIMSIEAQCAGIEKKYKRYKCIFVPKVTHPKILTQNYWINCLDEKYLAGTWRKLNVYYSRSVAVFEFAAFVVWDVPQFIL